MSFKLTEEGKRQVQEIRTNKTLILGICIGVVGNLLASVIENFFIQEKNYPLWYIGIIMIIFIGLIILTQKILLQWKIRIFKNKRLIKKAKKLITS